MKIGDVIKETKYLIFQVTKEKAKTVEVSVINRNGKYVIATIEWYPHWRQYVFIPTPEFDTVWNNTCLNSVISVLNELMENHVKTKPKGE